VAAAVTAATRAHAHLATDVMARGYSRRTRRALAKIGVVIGVLPWAIFVLIAGKNIVVASVLGWEAFPDTANPGYFLLKLALWVLAGLMLAQGIIGLFDPDAEIKA
jgi:TRAP-type mannitol/chloroaromatic compound transport system permease small subunit